MALVVKNSNLINSNLWVMKYFLILTNSEIQEKLLQFLLWNHQIYWNRGHYITNGILWINLRHVMLMSCIDFQNISYAFYFMFVCYYLPFRFLSISFFLTPRRWVMAKVLSPDMRIEVFFDLYIFRKGSCRLMLAILTVICKYSTGMGRSLSAARHMPDKNSFNRSRNANFTAMEGNEKKIMQFTIMDEVSLHNFSNSKNDSSITLWHSSITDGLNLRMPFTVLNHLISTRIFHSLICTITQKKIMKIRALKNFFFCSLVTTDDERLFVLTPQLHNFLLRLKVHSIFFHEFDFKFQLLHFECLWMWTAERKMWRSALEFPWSEGECYTRET